MVPILDPEIQSKVDRWLTEDYDENTKTTIKDWVKTNNPILSDAFYTDLEFGTGGMRGVMGIGTNRMNIYTVRRATQGLANYILKQEKDSPSVLIGYDSRINSRLFAEEAAKVLAANNIQVYIFSELRPTPLVSFGCRYKKCTAAIMVTASHNPPEYNGYKVYWDDGAQVLPPHDVGIIEEILKIKHLNEVKTLDSLDSPLIEWVLKDVDDAYLKAISGLPLTPDINHKQGKELKIVYTSLHGTGITLMPSVLSQAGFSNLSYVEKQIVPDGNFPYAKFPNPEEKAALSLGIQQMEETNSDLLIATDPDADRMGIAVNDHGQTVILNGNQIALLGLNHILEKMTLPKNAAFVKTIVTTELFKILCEAKGASCFNVLTGFKYVAEKIREWEESHAYQYIFGAEESYGYLWGTQTRDKDALTSALLFSELALNLKIEGKTLIDKLDDIYKKHGLFCEKQLSLKFPETKEGREKMAFAMVMLRDAPPASLAGKNIITIDDYLNKTSTDLKTGLSKPIDTHLSDMLIYWLEDQSKVIVRPSGTEPKLKIYCGVTKKDYQTIDDGLKNLNTYADTITFALKSFLDT